MTFWELADRSSQFANVLEELGVEQGDRVFSYMPRIQEHYVALVGTLWGEVPSGAAPTSASDRTEFPTDSTTAMRSVVVTTTDNRDTVEDALSDAPSVEHVITVDRGGGAPADDVVFNTALDDASTVYDAAETGGEDDALLYYTSGTTGLAKGVLHKHRWVAGVAATQKYAVDLQPGDLYWSTGDLGWLTGAINTPSGPGSGERRCSPTRGEFDPEEGLSCSTSTRSTSCSRSRRPTGCSVRKRRYWRMSTSICATRSRSANRSAPASWSGPRTNSA